MLRLVHTLAPPVLNPAPRSEQPDRPWSQALSSRPPEPFWWLGLAGLWAASTAADRLWLALDRRLPSWDQADYLNSAVDHGRALGLLSGGGWSGWAALLDLSPKIPPLASLLNGTVMAISGAAPDQASWALAIWHGLLLVVVACWGRQLLGRGFGLLSAALLACTPALAALRVDYTLDLALAATTSLALWRLGLWQAPAPRGGRWGQALSAALAIGAAVLVKQSALLLVAIPSLWAAAQGLGQGKRRLQVLAALAIVLGVCLPWLHHNWITTVGGTNRAVLESASAEGDPSPFSLESLLWYPLLWPRQLGPLLLPAIGALLAASWRWRQALPHWLRHPVRQLPPGWAWLIGCALSGWLLTSLSPNKDPRYFAPVLPLMILLLARGWWQIGLWLLPRLGKPTASVALAAGLVSMAGALCLEQTSALQRQDPAPVNQAMAALRGVVGDAPITLVMVPGSPDLNEQTVTTYGRLHGGRILARRLGRRRSEHALVLERSDWILLASGDQGTNRPISRELSRRVRADGRFELAERWPWTEGRQVELWRRRPNVEAARRFDPSFIALARGMERGPAGLKPLFDSIGAEHQLDGHFLYQTRVRGWAQQQLARHPDDPDALWSMALLSTLQNRPAQAQAWFGRLHSLQPSNPWPVAYRSVVLLADWKPWQAHAVLDAVPAALGHQPVIRGLRDISGLLSGHPQSLGSLRQSLPEAIESVKSSLDDQKQP